MLIDKADQAKVQEVLKQYIALTEAEKATGNRFTATKNSLVRGLNPADLVLFSVLLKDHNDGQKAGQR